MKSASTFTRPLAEMSRAGLRAASYPADIDETPLESLLGEHTASEPPPLPELCEPDVVRHFVNLSHKNMSVDTHFYPLGSCTMKYNPKRHERLGRVAGAWSICIRTRREDRLAGDVADPVSRCSRCWLRFQRPACRVAAAGGWRPGRIYSAPVCRGVLSGTVAKRSGTKVLFPKQCPWHEPGQRGDCGRLRQCVQLEGGTSTVMVDLEELQVRKLGDDTTAVFMITNPNTLGLFEKRHQAAISGDARPRCRRRSCTSTAPI